MKHYLSSLIFNNRKYGSEFRYQSYNEPVYRGIKIKYFMEEECIKYGIHYFPGLVSTTKSYDVALSYS